MLIISGVQGVGKTTLINLLLEKRPSLNLSVSSTTRPKRPKEEDFEYEFLTELEFNQKNRENYFIESVIVHGYQYGTPKHNFQPFIVFNVNPSSIQNFQSLIGDRYYKSIFIDADDDVIKKRLLSRKDNSCINKKLILGGKEKEYRKYFHHIIYNNKEIEDTLNDLLILVDKYLSQLANN